MLRTSYALCRRCLPLPCRHAATAGRATVLQGRIHGVVPRPFGGQGDVLQPAIEGDTYSINGTVSAAGLATLFDDTKGTHLVEGHASPASRCGRRLSVPITRPARRHRWSTSASPMAPSPPPRSSLRQEARSQELGAAGQRRPNVGARSDGGDRHPCRQSRQCLRAHGEILRRRDARRPDADLRLEGIDLGARLQGRYGDLPHGLRAGGGLSQGPQGA